MGLQENMDTDQIWIRNNPRNPVQQTNNYGQFYLNEGDSNFKEQLEMSYRTMGRAWDWDLEKYRNAIKGSDRGNKRRVMKNFARLVKNPVGYVFWKTTGGVRPYNFFNVVLLIAFGYGFAVYAKKARDIK